MLRTPLFYQVARDSSSVRIMDNGSRVIAEGMTPQEAREATKRCNVHLELVHALKDARAFIAADTLSNPMHVAGQLAVIDAVLIKAEAA